MKDFKYCIWYTPGPDHPWNYFTNKFIPHLSIKTGLTESQAFHLFSIIKKQDIEIEFDNLICSEKEGFNSLEYTIRLGWDDNNRNYMEVARALADHGASLVAVHGRTRSQAYSGEADWDAIAEIKQSLSIPVVGNGDVRTVTDIDNIKAHTGCDAVMIGRAVIGNPWILQRRDRQEVTLPDRMELVRRHLALNLKFYGVEKGLVLFRKHVARYIDDTPARVRKIRVPLLTCERVSDFENLLCSLGSEVNEPVGLSV